MMMMPAMSPCKPKGARVRRTLASSSQIACRAERTTKVSWSSRLLRRQVLAGGTAVIGMSRPWQEGSGWGAASAEECDLTTSGWPPNLGDAAAGCAPASAPLSAVYYLSAGKKYEGQVVVPSNCRLTLVVKSDANASTEKEPAVLENRTESPYQNVVRVEAGGTCVLQGNGLLQVNHRSPSVASNIAIAIRRHTYKRRGPETLSKRCAAYPRCLRMCLTG